MKQSRTLTFFCISIGTYHFSVPFRHFILPDRYEGFYQESFFYNFLKIYRNWTRHQKSCRRHGWPWAKKQLFPTPWALDPQGFSCQDFLGLLVLGPVSVFSTLSLLDFFPPLTFLRHLRRVKEELFIDMWKR